MCTRALLQGSRVDLTSWRSAQALVLWLILARFVCTDDLLGSRFDCRVQRLGFQAVADPRALSGVPI